MKMISNITKTTNITTSKQSINSNKPGVDDINVSVGLPKIGSNVKTNKHLAAIDDDYEEDYDERVPQKPKNLRARDTSEEEQERSLQINAQNSLKQLTNQRTGENLLPTTTPGTKGSGGTRSVKQLSQESVGQLRQQQK